PPTSATRTVITCDRPLGATPWAEPPKIEAGRYVAAADRLETIRPGYAVVKMQQRQPRTAVAVTAISLSDDGRNVAIETGPRVDAVNYALALPSGIDLAHDLSGVDTEWTGAPARG